jgi:hypothetical protein
VWDSRFLGANFPLSNNDLPDEDLLQRLDQDVKARAQQSAPSGLDPMVLARAQAVLQRFEGLTPDDL